MNICIFVLLRRKLRHTYKTNDPGNCWLVAEGKVYFAQVFDYGVHDKSRYFPTLKILWGFYLSQKSLSKRNKAFSSKVKTSEFGPEKYGLVSSRAFFFSGRVNKE